MSLNASQIEELLRLTKAAWNGESGNREDFQDVKNTIQHWSPEDQLSAIAFMLRKIRRYGREALAAQCCRFR